MIHDAAVAMIALAVGLIAGARLEATYWHRILEERERRAARYRQP